MGSCLMREMRLLRMVKSVRISQLKIKVAYHKVQYLSFKIPYGIQERREFTELSKSGEYRKGLTFAGKSFPVHTLVSTQREFSHKLKVNLSVVASCH